VLGVWGRSVRFADATCSAYSEPVERAERGDLRTAAPVRGSGDAMAEWKTAAHLTDHFGDHGRELGCDTVEAYDASAQSTLDAGTYFEYFDHDAQETRTGCYDHRTQRLTVLDRDDRIVTHFRCPEWYVRGLSYSNYERPR
jgi:hypothetical protein